MSPCFGDVEYWDRRYTKNRSSFEWLVAPATVDKTVLRAAQLAAHDRPRLLHIGCGTSSLSLHLRELVAEPSQVHNTDYSAVAIDIGREWERDCYGPPRPQQQQQQQQEHRQEQQEGEGEEKKEKDRQEFDLSTRPDDDADVPSMRWSKLDLLDVDAITALGEPGGYDVVVDKSTCDSVSCADDVAVPFPYPLVPAQATDPRPPAGPDEGPPRPSAENVHPLTVLGVHLAYLTPPGARWVAISYSKTRFGAWWGAPNAAPAEVAMLDSELERAGVPHPGQLWRLESTDHIGLDTPQPDGGSQNKPAYRPTVVYNVYNMIRTDVVLEARPS